MSALQLLGNRISEIKGRRDAHISIRGEARSKLIKLEGKAKHIDRAAEIIRTVAEATQRKLQYQISELATMAQKAIFPDPYKVVVEFIQKRGQTEAEVYFERSGNRVDPLEASGHGPADIASFALRISLWLLSRKRSRNTFILDEPFKNIHGVDLQIATWKMVRSLSRRLNIQFLIVTQFEGLEEEADRVFRVTMKNEVSHVSTDEAPKLKLRISK